MDSPSEVLKLLCFVCRLQIGSTGGKQDVIWGKVHSGRANSLEKTLMLGKIEAGGEGGNRLTDDEIVGRHH